MISQVPETAAKNGRSSLDVQEWSAWSAWSAWSGPWMSSVDIPAFEAAVRQMREQAGPQIVGQQGEVGAHPLCKA